PAELPSQQMPWGSCLIHNWQEERATNQLDAVPGHESGTEAFIHRHGHQGPLVHQFFSWPTSSMTTDIYWPLAEGCRVCSPVRKEMQEEICPQEMPMESVSTTHQDYRAEDCQFMPLLTSQHHNYLTEQPCSFWLEQAHSLPGVTSTGSKDSPFRRNAAFSTPITE
ncbi:SPAG8 protein, partial [Chloroceryle aenea]|nr:SPAG8 protein [Chloroceryle aenea]